MKNQLFTKLFRECHDKSEFSDDLRNALAKMSKTERREIVSQVKDGYTPLLVACMKDRFKLVKYLIKQCNADLEQISEFIDSHFITPLFYASFAGKKKIVKLLVRHGAKINTTSNWGVSAIMIACTYGHYDIVVFLIKHNADILKPNYKGNTCLMQSFRNVHICKFLIEKGADVNARCVQKTTALHLAIDNKCIEVIHLLLINGADPYLKNHCRLDAIKLASFRGLTDIVEYLIENYTYSPERIAETHELLGCSFVLRKYNKEKCLQHWRTSLVIRNDNSIPKQCVKKPYSANVYEFNSFKELENLSRRAINIQALLVCERLLEDREQICDVIFSCSDCCYFDFDFKYKYVFNLQMYALELYLEKYTLFDRLALPGIQSLIGLFVYFMDGPHIKFLDVFQLLRLLVPHLEEAKNLLNLRPVFEIQQYDFDDIMTALTYEIYLLYSLERTSEETICLKKLIKTILELELRDSRGDTLLHLVLNDYNIMEGIILFPNTGVAQFLLECGANVESVNYDFSTPLHIVTFINSSLLYSPEPNIVHLLLKYGAHIDRRNDNGYTPIPSWTDNNVFQYVTLKCLAARKIVEKQIPYPENIPVSIKNYIRMH